MWTFSFNSQKISVLACKSILKMTLLPLIFFAVVPKRWEDDLFILHDEEEQYTCQSLKTPTTTALA